MPFEGTTRTSRDVGMLCHAINIAHVCVMTMIYLSLFQPTFELDFLLTHHWFSGAGMFGEPKNYFQTYRPINNPFAFALALHIFCILNVFFWS